MLTARFHKLRDRALAAVDETFAEKVRLSFMKNGQPDPARPMREIEAPLRVGGGKESSVSGGTDQAWRTRLQAQRGELHIDRAKYPDLKFIKNDRVRALSRPGEPWFEVLAVDDRLATRLVVHLGEA